MSRVVWLENTPSRSHSFIDSEVRALRQAGMSIDRVAVRQADTFTSGDHWCLLDNINKMDVARQTHRMPRITKGMAGGPKLAAYFAEAVTLARYTTEYRIGHVHAHFSTNAATVAWIWSRLTGGTWSFTVHGADDEFRQPAAADIRGKVASAEFVAAVSHYTRAAIMGEVPASGWGKIKVVPCFPNPMFEQPPTPPRPDGPVVWINRFSEEKAPSLALEVAKLGEFPLVMAGDGPLRDLTKIQAIHMKREVEFPGWVTQSGVLDLIDSARCVLSTSLREGVPVTLMEAAMRGRPIVAPRLHGIPELVSDPRVGALYHPGSAVHAAGAVLDAVAMHSPEIAIRTVGQSFNPARSSRDMIDLLETAMKVRR